MKPAIVPVLAALMLAAPVVAATAPSKAIVAAIADPARPEADRARDAARKPGELLMFAGVKPGAKVADFIMGGGYLTRILAKAVGPTGKVYAYQPEEFIKFRAEYAPDQDKAVKGYANVVPSRESLGAVAFPEKLDAIVTVQNWHDLHLKQATPDFAGKVAAMLFAALKPGGTLVVVDHAGTPGATPFAVADSLHRGDADATKKEIEAAGFRLEAQSPIYANAADPHTAIVFDPAIRGRTDQFVYKFRKPK